MTATTPVTQSSGHAMPAWLKGVFLIGPLVLLAGVIALFLWTDGAGLDVEPAAPVEAVQFTSTTLAPNQIRIDLRNTSPEPITLSYVNINDAIWPFRIQPDRTLDRLEEATVILDYPWIEAQAYTITLFTENSVALTTEIGVATETQTTSAATLGSLTLVGLYVGVIPVVLGMLWLPVLHTIGDRTMRFLMAATVGLLLFLGVDAFFEAFELAQGISGPLQGVGVMAIGLVGAIALLNAIGRAQLTEGLTAEQRRGRFATMVAIGMGLHNLGEGLAIGAAFALGEASLGTFLVIGFIIQNITEGLGVVVPLARQRPGYGFLASLALVAGAPAIVGAWIGGLAIDPVWSMLFLAIGAGAVFQVAWQIGRELVWNEREGRDPMPLTAFSGLMAGMLALFVTGLIIK
jgi:zinc transporter, ZIP family